MVGSDYLFESPLFKAHMGSIMVLCYDLTCKDGDKIIKKSHNFVNCCLLENLS